ncbi:PTS fructose-like transporter subunit IIB [Allohahella sp. A8]|uniref:PTS fructose-like transporter subunit IIB n=1 Tax=Allohahella sp. A8 TaxID=3141461 RepID=UPI000C0B10FE|nr:PTS fructose transporter subunit EIIBC [Hahellaceae bacterium]|tara:strand:- start:43761 stop:45551 length:1791 start_codon:yes stop_codon:yes gene_type:complete
MNVLILTQCPAGLTSCYLAATALARAAAELNWSITTEIHSSVQPVQHFSAAQIAAADLVVLAADGHVDLGRFAGKRIFRGPVAACLTDPMQWLQFADREASVQQAQDTSTGLADSAATSPVPGLADGKTVAQTREAFNIVAVTACPTGVAHTFMAAEALEATARQLGHRIKVETRGSVGAANALTDDNIADADLVILAVDIEVDTSRFTGKRIYRCSTGAALKKPMDIVQAAISNAKTEGADSSEGSSTPAPGKAQSGIYKHLMTGVSFMLPVVVAGGLIIALSFVFGIEAFKEEGSLPAALMMIGGETAFALMIPVLAGYIAFSIADRPGLAPGLIGGMLASSLGAGFLGGILAGFIAGYCAKALVDYVRLPKSVESLKPILIVPLLASLATGLIMIYIVGTPVAAVMSSLTGFLQGMGSTNAVVLGIILGAMMCFDLGGPVNKAAYTFGVGLLASQSYAPMAAIMAAGMVPALGLGVATFIRKRQFSKTEQEAGKAAFVLGLCFISEGAIPFAAKDPVRVLPACILGGATTGALSMLVGAKLMAPHGGIFVLFIPNAITPALLYLGAIAAGTMVTALLYLILRSRNAVPATATA